MSASNDIDTGNRTGAAGPFGEDVGEPLPETPASDVDRPVASPEPSGLIPSVPEPADDPKALYGDRYAIEGILGRGGMCSVYRAWDTRLHRHVAIKRLEPPQSEDPQARARFHHEGKAIARLSHPNLVTLIERGSTDTDEYLVFECVEGRSLKEIIQDTGPMEPADAGQIIGQVAEGLAHAHLAGIVHRDVKPQNILIDGEGRAKLTDFGIATGLEWTKVTREGSILGSTRYMSPEQVQSRPVDSRSDIYSLGIVMYEMLTGRPPFDGPTVSDIGRQHVRSRPPSLLDTRADLPVALDKLVQRCLEKLPESRFESMEALLGSLVALDLYALEPGTGGIMESFRRAGHAWDDTLGGGASGTLVPSPEMPAERSERRADLMLEHRRRKGGTRRRRLYAAAAAVVILAAVALAVALSGGKTVAPAVVGKTVEQATSLAESRGLKVSVTKQVPDAASSVGVVLSQEPDSGKHPDDNTLRLTVTRAPIAVKTTSVKDSDPLGVNLKENPDLIKRLTDGNEATGWVTESYDSSDFAGLKKTGVGVIFQLAEPATMVEIVSSDQGWKGELQTPGDDGTMTKVVDLKGAHRQTITLSTPTKTGRIWLTGLVAGKDGLFVVHLNELRFFR